MRKRDVKVLARRPHTDFKYLNVALGISAVVREPGGAPSPGGQQGRGERDFEKNDVFC